VAEESGSHEELVKLERRVAKRRAGVDQSLVERGRLKWFVLLAVVTWPLGLIWNGWIAAWIFFGWLTFWAVGAYTNFFHLRRAREALAEAEQALERAREQ
jgi:hypothetical protein